MNSQPYTNDQVSSAPISRKAHALRMVALVTLSAFIGVLFWSEDLYAQAPDNFRIPFLGSPDAESGSTAQVEPSEADHTTVFPPLIIDTDPGIDDAVALAWLLSQPEANKIAGIVSVAGNTTVENATQNVSTILQLVGNSDVPVIEGATKPLNQQLSSTGMLLHGPDGLWGSQLPSASSARSRDARRFYCSNANADTTILALGPLTNIAEAIRHCRNDMRKYDRIVILGGAKFGGNITPVAEFNFWQDPEAAQIVLESDMEIDLVPLDAFTQLEFGAELFGAINPEVTPPVFLHLASALGLYAGLQGFPSVPLEIPDLVAAMVTVKPGLVALAAAGQVEIIERPDLVRGQSVIGFDLERVTMIADDKEISRIAEDAFALTDDPYNPDELFGVVFSYVFAKTDEILARVPPNANVVREIFARALHDELLNFVASSSVAGAVKPSEADQSPNTIYMPSITTD